MSAERIAIVGIGARYPDASSAAELWDNVLSGRRAFRRLPDGRMNREDYWSPDPQAPDRFYSEKAAVLRDFEFDRVKYRVAGSTFRSTDMTHWLALDVASHALADAGFADGEGLPRQRTGVILGNSLTGEFSRANLMRLRWPYVRRTVAAALTDKGWGEEETTSFLRDLEIQYKAPFPEINEDSLAGGLANTIAGRICNYFDLAGGGFTVDGACSSSLLSVATAANSLVDGDLDVALAGGVDLSIDPFEVIGFAKTGALATGEMRVYDQESNGFWPGEGAGVLVLMRERDALERGARIYASVAGWGISSDGKGGITRPEAGGHRLALARAYDRAGYGPETVSYFEGHGTGTALGDATEIEALSSARRDAGASTEPAALSTIKGNIGHTKAAAGVAGLIKAALAVHHQVIPPATGHRDPHPLLTAESAAMYVPSEARLWPAGDKIRAGVSAMGFGGINTHIAVEQAPGVRRRDQLDGRTRELVDGRQDVELLLLDGPDLETLRARLVRLIDLVPVLAMSEVADLASTLAGELSEQPFRAALVVSGAEDASRKLGRLRELIDQGVTAVFATTEGIFLDHHVNAPKIGFLFPGQGSGTGAVGAIRRRFTSAEEIFHVANVDGASDQVATEVAQPRIVAGSLAGLRVLRGLGVEADIAVGHSLGELTALHWAGALGERAVLRLAGRRGEVMASASSGDGAMAGLATDPNRAELLIEGDDVVIAGYNAPRQTVISGPSEAVERVCERARLDGVGASRINVSHAFHSEAVEPAAEELIEYLREFEMARPNRPMVSTVTGGALHGGEDIRELLRDQVVLPVRFREAAARAAERSDLMIELGPGRVLSGLMTEIDADTPVMAVDTDNGSLRALLSVLGAAFAKGAALNARALFEGRVVRPLSLDSEMTFLESPCEAAPATVAGLSHDDTIGDPAMTAADSSPSEPRAVEASPSEEAGNSTFELLRQLAADRVELPLEAVTMETHPLDDLHLSSITVGQLVNDVTRTLGRPALEAMPNFATVCLGELAEMIDELDETARSDGSTAGEEVAGVEPWVRPFAVEYVPSERPIVDTGRGEPVHEWSVYAPEGHPLAERLRLALSRAGVGDGVVLCLPDDCTEDDFGLFLDAGRTVLSAPNGTRFVVVQQQHGASGLAKTLRLEDPSVPTTIVTLADAVPSDDDEIDTAVSRVVIETAATTDFSEVRYDEDGARSVPALRAITQPSTDRASSPLGLDDVLLVTGGGKGITAETALAMAADSRAALALLGRGDPAEDEELARNLSRMDSAGVRYRYERADVTSAEQVQAAVNRFESALGTVTAVLHGAGRNEPAALFSLTEETFRETFAPKIGGLRTVLGALDEDRLKLLVTFGSIIGRAGLRGEAHYATANDWLTEETLAFQRRNPDARVHALEWSVWSGSGMGERLGVLGALMRDGITPIPTEEGIAVLRRILAEPATPPVLVVCGRTGGLATLPVRRGELPLTRFVDRAVVHYPGIELVTESDLSVGSDPYLGDHQLDGDLLFPAVMGMEAMTQVASAVLGSTGSPVLENVEFLRPVAVVPQGSTTIRLAALAKDAETVDVVLRSAETGFSADHFRARLRFPRPDFPGETASTDSVLPMVSVDPIADLYGGMLFQGKRFQRLTGYRTASARRAVADIAAGEQASWFAPFLPQQQILADPGTRDTMMHALQCCVPDAILLPRGIERLYLSHKAEQDTEFLVLDARERVQDGDTYVYDLVVRDSSGEVVEQWDGLSLRAVRTRGGAGPWVPAMLGSYLERSLEGLLGGSRSIVVEPDPADREVSTTAQRRARTEVAVSRAFGQPVVPRYRPDGKPEVDGSEVSASHGAGITFAVTGSGELTCDVEVAIERSDADWTSLLGADLLAVRDLLADETGESVEVASTRVWAAVECVRKTGHLTRALTVRQVAGDGWVVLASGQARIATWVTTIHDRTEPVVFAVLQANAH